MKTSIKIVSIVIILVVIGFTLKFINDAEIAKQNQIENTDLQKILTKKVWVWDKTYEGIELGMDLNKKFAPNNPDAFTITFNEDDTFSGTTDCNNFTGNYYLNGVNITFENIATTKKYCNYSQETEFIKMINDGYVSIIDNVLYLENTSTEPEFTVIFNSVYENVFDPNKEPVITPTYKNASADLIQVELPYPGAVTGKEFTIIGKARGYWFFEASFPVELQTLDGNILGGGVATAEGEWMTEEFVNFTAEMQTPSAFTGPAILILRKDNPSGLPENDASISFPINVQF